MYKQIECYALVSYKLLVTNVGIINDVICSLMLKGLQRPVKPVMPKAN